MKVVNVLQLRGTARAVDCPNGGFTSLRALLASDKMGFTMTRTTVHPTKHFQKWYYKHHLEACYCIKGRGLLRVGTRVSKIHPGILYAADKHDKHFFKAIEPTVLLCVFNPPLLGKEVHLEDGSYALMEGFEK
jgi:L-ectoine synthase